MTVLIYSRVYVHIFFECVCVCRCRMGWCSLTKNKNSMAKRLSTVGLHGDVQHGGIAPDDADAVVLLCLSEHSQQLIGYDSVQSRYGDHGHHKGQKSIDLFKEKGQKRLFLNQLNQLCHSHYESTLCYIKTNMYLLQIITLRPPMWKITGHPFEDVKGLLDHKWKIECLELICWSHNCNVM